MSPRAPQSARTASAVVESAPRQGTLDEGIEFLVELAATCDSPKAFVRESLRGIGALLQSPCVAAEVRHGASVIEEEYAADSRAASFWSATLQSALTSALAGQGPKARLYRGRDIPTRLGLFSCPVSGGAEGAQGALVAVMRCEDEVEARHKLDVLGALAHLMAILLGTVGVVETREPAATGSHSILKRVAGFTSGTELAFSLTNRLCTRDGCDQVALALVRGRRVELLSISGLDHISQSSPGVRRIREAMEECLDLARPTLFQTEGRVSEEDITVGMPLHRQWSAAAGGAPVASIPLREGGAIVALLAVRRARVSPFTAGDLQEFRELVEPYVPAIELVDRARRPLWRHLQSSLRELWKRLRQREHRKSRHVAILGALAFSWIFFGSVDYEVRVPCSLSPVQSRHLAAPFDGVLAEVLRVPGDPVHAGEVLARMDAAEVDLEARRLRSELAVLDLEEARSLASDSPLDLQLVRAQRKQAQANLDLQLHRLDRASLRSPVDGVLLSGDLRDRVGELIPMGQGLLEVSGEAGWQLEMRIPEADVGSVEVGMRGRFASRARPEQEHEFVIVSVDPRARQERGENVFEARALVDVREEWMRSGMEGQAQVEVGVRSPIWVALHRVVDRVRMSLWL